MRHAYAVGRTLHLRHSAPVGNSMKPRRNRAVACRCFVGLFHFARLNVGLWNARLPPRLQPALKASFSLVSLYFRGVSISAPSDPGPNEYAVMNPSANAWLANASSLYGFCMLPNVSRISVGLGFHAFTCCSLRLAQPIRTIPSRTGSRHFMNQPNDPAHRRRAKDVRMEHQRNRGVRVQPAG